MPSADEELDKSVKPLRSCPTRSEGGKTLSEEKWTKKSAAREEGACGLDIPPTEKKMHMNRAQNPS